MPGVVEDEDAMTDQSNSARVSIVSLGDRPNQKDPEVIEGTGLWSQPLALKADFPQRLAFQNR
jgi:hypothetical protein